MAPKQAARPGVADYIHNKEAGNDHRQSGNASRTASYNDLKVDVPKPGHTANDRQLRSRRSDGVQHLAQEAHLHTGRQSDGKAPFYGTDASSVGRTSDTPGNPQVTHAQQTQHRSNGGATHATQAQPDSRYSSSDYGGEDGLVENGSNDLPDNPLDDGLNDNQRRLMQRTDANRVNGQTGGLGYMEGDSFPATTSGPPSHIEPKTYKQAPSKQDDVARPPPFPDRNAQRRQAGGQPPPDRRPGQPLPQQTQPQHQQSHAAPAQLTRPAAADQAALQQEAAASFRFGAAPKPKVCTKAAPNDQRPREAAASRSRQHLSTNIAQPASEVRVDYKARQPVPDAPTRVEQYLPQGHPNADRPSKAELHANGKPQQVKPPVAEQPRPEPAQDDADLVDSQEQEEQETPAEEDQMDYDLAELYDMDFTELQKQPFDEEPKDRPTFLPGVAIEDPVDKQMATVSAFQPQDQYNFLKAMPVDEWEQAGDWFLGKFGQNLTELKKLRQEKRKAAHAFEKEVEGRHVAVVKKRKITDSALGDMKASGKLVLEGTPKKGKKTK